MNEAVDHAGMESVGFAECLRLMGSVPVGRIAFDADGEVVVLPVNHAVDGQDVVFRTAPGSKLDVAERQQVVSFEVDAYAPMSGDAWSVLLTGRAEQVLDDSEIRRLEGLGVETWPAHVHRAHWIRIRPTGVTGRRIRR